jgi:hypothetical protein
MLVGDDDFIRGRSFESVRFRYQTDKSTSDLMWVQLYQPAPDTVNFDWNHPIFLGLFNTFQLSNNFSIDANLHYIIDQYNNGYRTSVLIPDIRLFGQNGNIRYSAEFIYQTGSTRGLVADDKLGDVSAYAFEAGAGFVGDDEKYTVDLSYYLASGDELNDENIKSFNVLWQNEHRRFGYIDAFKGSNVQAVTLHADVRLNEYLSTGIHGVVANVIEQYDRSSGVIASSALPDFLPGKSIGAGGDWYLNYYFSDYLNMQLSVSLFNPGDYFTAVSGIEDMMVRGFLLLMCKI